MAFFMISIFFFNIIIKTFFWFRKTNILQYFPHYFQMLLYYILLRGIRSKRQRNPGENVWTKWIWNDISKKSWKWVMKPLRCRWKLRTTEFIALQTKHMIWMVFLELFLGIFLLCFIIKQLSFVWIRLIHVSCCNTKFFHILMHMSLM